MFNAKTKKAFTIVELVIVIAVIAILMGIMFVGGTAISNNAKESSLSSDFRTFETNLKAMVNDPGANVIQKNLDLTPAADASKDVVNLVNNYFEGDIALKDGTFVDVANTQATIAAFEAESTLNDPYGMPYKLVVLDNSTPDHTDISFIIYSFGKNKQTAATQSGVGYWDKDDVMRIIRFVDSVVYTEDVGPNGADANHKLTADTTYQAAANKPFTGQDVASKFATIS